MDDALVSDLRDAAGKASNSLEEQMKEIREDLARLRETVSGLVSKGSSVISAQVATARDRVKERAGELIQSGQEFAGQTYERAKDREADLEDIIQRHPIIAVTTALSLGAFLGAALTTSSTRRY